MYLTLGQAAKESGKSKATISKYLKNGKLSYVSKKDSGYQIDPAELFRVFPKGELVNTKNERLETPMVNTDLHLKNKELEIKHEAAIQTIKSLEADKEDYKNRLDAEGEERRKLTMMITDQYRQSEKTTEKGRGFFGKLFGL